MECAETARASPRAAWQVTLLPTSTGRVAPPTLLQAWPSCVLWTGWMAQQQRELACHAVVRAAMLPLSLRACPCALRS